MLRHKPGSPPPCGTLGAAAFERQGRAHWLEASSPRLLPSDAGARVMGPWHGAPAEQVDHNRARTSNSSTSWYPRSRAKSTALLSFCTRRGAVRRGRARSPWRGNATYSVSAEQVRTSPHKVRDTVFCAPVCSLHQCCSSILHGKTSERVGSASDGSANLHGPSSRGECPRLLPPPGPERSQRDFLLLP